jgi:hypothetical protein
MTRGVSVVFFPRQGALDPVAGPEVRPRRRLPAIVLEPQQRGILQAEHGQPRQQMIDQRDLVSRHVGDPHTHPPCLAPQPFGAEVFA